MRNQEIAQTIISQIGNMALRMLGAKNLLIIDKGLQLDVRGSRKATRILITLAPDDTYTMKFYKGKGVRIREVASKEGIYFDMLCNIIEDVTGLYTRF